MRLRFTIRDLLWLTALIAMALGWWIDHLRIERIAGSEAMIQNRKIEVLEADRKALLDDAMQIWIERNKDSASK